MCLLCFTLAPFWRVSTERKQRMLFCVSYAISCFCSNQSINNAENISRHRKCIGYSHNKKQLLVSAQGLIAMNPYSQQMLQH